MDDTLTTAPAGFDKTGKILYLTDSRGRDTGAPWRKSTSTAARETCWPRTIGPTSARRCSHPTEKNIQAVAFNYERQAWKVLDPAIADDMEYLQGRRRRRVASHQPHARRQDLDRRLPDGRRPGALLPSTIGRTRKPTFLFTNRKSLEGLPLAKMHPVVIKSRDGLNLVSYLTLPKASDPDDDGPARASRCRWCCSSTAARGPATTGASTPSINCWPIAATPC